MVYILFICHPEQQMNTKCGACWSCKRKIIHIIDIIMQRDEWRNKLTYNVRVFMRITLVHHHVFATNIQKPKMTKFTSNWIVSQMINPSEILEPRSTKSFILRATLGSSTFRWTSLTSHPLITVFQNSDSFRVRMLLVRDDSFGGWRRNDEWITFKFDVIGIDLIWCDWGFDEGLFELELGQNQSSWRYRFD